MKNKKIIITAIVLVAVIAIMGAVYGLTRPTASEGGKHIAVTVVHADASEAVFEYDTDEEYLGDVLTAEGLVQGEESEYGLYITVVDGEEAIYENDGSYWAFYIDGEYATTGVDATPVTDGGNYSLIYTND